MSEELREKIKDILNENIDNDANWNDGPNPEKALEDLLTLISHERAEAVSIILNLPRIRKGYYNEETGESEDTIRVKILEEYLSNERFK